MQTQSEQNKALQKSIAKVKAFYDITPGAPLYQKEFGYYCLDKWIEQGYLKKREEVADYDAYLAELFHFDTPAIHYTMGLGFCEAGMCPWFEEKVLEDRGEYELVQDVVGRKVLCFKGRRSGFMPTYEDHPVKDIKSFEENILWRLDPNSPLRISYTDEVVLPAMEAAEKGMFLSQMLPGAYMYLRSLIGPEELLYTVYDDPALIHKCLEAWFTLNDTVLARYQERLVFDEVFFGEDICYNSGPLISPDMIKEFLLPYYQQLYQNMKRRNRDNRPLHFQLDTDGFCNPVIDLYRSVGCDFVSPFEVASNCSVVQTGKQYPDLRMAGGIDKRVLAQGREAIKRHLDSILPVMREHGGYIPTCDHGVPEEVPFEDYLFYREQMLQYAE